MAGGIFIKGVSKVCPGTYTNFTDVDMSLASSGGSIPGGGGGGGGGKPGDYTFGIIVAVSTVISTAAIKTDFVAAAEDVYCGTLVYN